MIDLSIIDLQILLDLVNKEYEKSFQEYIDNKSDSFKFSHILDCQALRKRINEILVEKRK